jgi:hypothetical protein
MDAELIAPWMVYMARLDKEAQGMFANGVRDPKYGRMHIVATNSAFSTWARENSYLFSADVR